MTTSTPKSVFSLDTLTKDSRGKKTALQALSGTFITPMFKTADYTLELITYVLNKVEGQPINGVFFRVTTNEDTVFESASQTAAIKYADEYSQNEHSKVRVNIDFSTLSMDDYEKVKVDSHTYIFDFKALGFTIVGIHKDTVLKGYGFMPKDKVKKAHKKVKGLFVPMLNK
jgi:hypothetical protein